MSKEKNSVEVDEPKKKCPGEKNVVGDKKIGSRGTKEFRRNKKKECQRGPKSVEVGKEKLWKRKK